jgi:hypothetical protein
MRFVDAYFFEKNTIRYFFLLKYNYLNFSHYNLGLPFLKKLYLNFNIIDAQDVDSLFSSNYAYLLRYFFGCKAFVLNYKSRYHLGVWYYSFQIRSLAPKNYYPFILYMISNDIIPKIGYDFEVKSYKNLCYLVLKDLNIFLDWNSSVGLFNLRHNLEFDFIFNLKNYKCTNILNFYKIDII